MPVGITQSSLEAKGLSRSFRTAAAASADGIEITCASLEELEALLAEKGPAQVKRLKQAHGLEVPSLGLKLMTEGRLLFSDAAGVASAAKLIGRAMAAAGEIGADVVLLPFQGKAAIETEAAFERLLSVLTELAEQAEEAKVTLGVESTLNLDQQLFLMDHLASYGTVKVYFDTANILARKLDPATCLRDLGAESVCQIHLHDIRLGEVGAPPLWDVPLGEGDVDFQAVAQAMHAIGFEGWSMVEVARCDEAAAKASIEFARGLWADQDP